MIMLLGATPILRSQQPYDPARDDNAIQQRCVSPSCTKKTRRIFACRYSLNRPVISGNCQISLALKMAGQRLEGQLLMN